MELSHYFQPIDLQEESSAPSALGQSMKPYSDQIDVRLFDFALMYIEHRPGDSAQNEYDFRAEAEQITHQLATFFVHGNSPSVLVMGTFIPGETQIDTDSGLAEVLSFFIKQKVMPLIIGGSRSLTYAVYKAFERDEQVVNITSIDFRLHLNDNGPESYIARIIKEQPNFLFNYANIGYQTYYASPEEVELLDDLYFDAYRLGLVRGNVQSIEPAIRSAEVTSFSFDAIKASDFSAGRSPQPNGLYAEEACQIMRYAGMSEITKTILLSDIGGALSPHDQLLVATMIWCVVDGYINRKPEIPGSNPEGFLKYRVPLRNDEFQLIFYKSLSTDRWWMEVPVPPQYANKYRKHHLIPCAYEDYAVATRDDLPERWWKAYKKML